MIPGIACFRMGTQPLARISCTSTLGALTRQCRKRAHPAISSFFRSETLVKTPICQIREFSLQFQQSPLAAPQPILSQTTSRSLSSQGRKNTAKNSDVLSNEDLLLQLRTTFPKANGPENIQVRLVIDEGPNQPATVQVCSLADAIEVSLDRMTDLIGVSLQSDPPVIRATKLSKLEYQKEQASAKQKTASKSKQTKTFRFRAGIDMHDLNRKLQDMEKFLEKGVECEYTVFSKARSLRENSAAGQELVDRIMERVSHCAVLKRAPQTNETGNQIRVQLSPKKS